MEVTVQRLNKLEDPKGNTKGFADIKYGNLVLKGYKVVENKDGELFVSPPSHADKDGNWYPDIYPVDRKADGGSAIQALINKAVLAEFNK